MKSNKTWWAVLVLCVLLGVTGCNAISFFPREAGTRAADRVLDDILPGDGTQVEPAKPSAPETP